MKKSAGFTLIELLVVMAIGAVLATAGFLTVGGYRSSQNLQLSLSEILSATQGTQKRAISQQDGTTWGVRFSNSSSSSGQYTIFGGPTFATTTATSTYPMRRGILFSNPPASSTIDVPFGGFTGLPMKNQIISLVDGTKDALVGDVVVNDSGTITSRLEKNLVGYWHFDENTSTTAYDASGMGNKGTASGTVWATGSSCKAGSCLSFNGATTTYVNAGTGSSLSFPNNFTLSAWVYPTAYHTVGYFGLLNGFMGRGPSSTYNYALETKDAATITFVKRTGAESLQYYNFTVPSLTNQWTHVVMTISPSLVASLYINGVFSSQQTISGTIAGVPGDILYIGNSTPNQSEAGFIGLIDEVRIYNRALSATEILNQYNELR